MDGYSRWNPDVTVNLSVDYFIKYRLLYSFTYHVMHVVWSALSRNQILKEHGKFFD
jgi:hypothetical protein